MTISFRELGEVANLQAGLGFPTVLQGKTVGDYPFAKVGDISRACRNGLTHLTSADNFVSAAEVNQLKAKIIPRGSVLFAKIGEAIRQNHRVIAGTEMLVDNNAMAAIPKNLVDGQYLYHFLRTLDFYALTSSTTVPALRKSDLERIQIPLPPLSEQKRIAEILDRAEVLRSKRRAALALLDELTQSIFLDMFGDPTVVSESTCVTLEEVADIITGFAFKSSEFALCGDSIRLCRGANVLPNIIDWSDVVYWPNNRVAEFEKFELALGDVVIAMDRPWISTGFKIAQISASDCPSLLVQRVARIRGNKVTNAFLYHLLKQQGFARHCKPTETTVPHISPNDIRTFRFANPTRDALHEFDSQVGVIEEMRTSIVESEELNDALFASLQQRAFRGEL